MRETKLLVGLKPVSSLEVSTFEMGRRERSIETNRCLLIGHTAKSMCVCVCVCVCGCVRVHAC